MNTFTNTFRDQYTCIPNALNTIFPSEKTNTNTVVYPFERSFEDLLKTKFQKGRKVYRALEGLRKSKSSAPLEQSVKKKKSLPPIKLFEPTHYKKESGPYVLGKSLRISPVINFHRKLLQFNQKRITKENHKQINDFNNCFTNSYFNDDDYYTHLGSMNISPINTKQDNSSSNSNIKEMNSYSVLKSNKWDISLQGFLQNKFEKTKKWFYLNKRDKMKMNNTTVILQDDIKGDMNKRVYKSQQGIFKSKIRQANKVKIPCKALSRLDSSDQC